MPSYNGTTSRIMASPTWLLVSKTHSRTGYPTGPSHRSIPPVTNCRDRIPTDWNSAFPGGISVFCRTFPLSLLSLLSQQLAEAVVRARESLERSFYAGFFHMKSRCPMPLCRGDGHVHCCSYRFGALRLLALLTRQLLYKLSYVEILNDVTTTWPPSAFVA